MPSTTSKASITTAQRVPGSGLTAQQVRWAAQHDWYDGESGEPHAGLTVRVVDSFTLGGELHTERHEFRDFPALRAWAGY